MPKNAISTGLRTVVALTWRAAWRSPRRARDRRHLPRRGLPPGFDAGRADAAFERPSRHYLDAASCDADGPGLVVSHARGRTPSGRWGAWSISAPGGGDLAPQRLCGRPARWWQRPGARGRLPGRAAGTDRYTPEGATAHHLVGLWSPGGRGAPSLSPGLRLRPRQRCPGSHQAPRREAQRSPRPDSAAGRLGVRPRKQARPTDNRTVQRRCRRRRSAPARAGERRAGHGTNGCPADSPIRSRSGFAPARSGRAPASAPPPRRRRSARGRTWCVSAPRITRRTPPPTGPVRSAGSGSTTSARSPWPRAGPRSAPACAGTGRSRRRRRSPS